MKVKSFNQYYLNLNGSSERISRLIILCLLALLSSCASSSGVRKASNNQFWVQGSSDLGLGMAKGKANKEASKFCGSALAVFETSSSAGSYVDFLGDRVDTWKLWFTCGKVSYNKSSGQPSGASVAKSSETTQSRRDLTAYKDCESQASDQVIIRGCTEIIRINARSRVSDDELLYAALFNRSLAFARQQYYRRAIDDIERVVQRSPDDHEARRLLNDYREDLQWANQSRRSSSQLGGRQDRQRNRTSSIGANKERWDIELSGINHNLVNVNNRQIFKQKKGRNSINIGQFFKGGRNNVEIWRKHFGATKGQRALLKRGGRTILVLQPIDFSPMAFESGLKKPLVKLEIERDTGRCWILRGWGVIHGRVKLGNRHFDISGWEPCEQYRYIPEQGVSSHAMPIKNLNPTKLQILNSIYKNISN